MFKLLVAMLFAAYLLLSFVLPSPSPGVERSTEFVHDNSAAISCNITPVAEIKNLSVGAPLYHALSRGPIAIVAAIDPTHEFACGAIAPGVLLEYEDGAQFWLRHEHVNLLLTRKEQTNRSKSKEN